MKARTGVEMGMDSGELGVEGADEPAQAVAVGAASAGDVETPSATAGVVEGAERRGRRWISVMRSLRRVGRGPLLSSRHGQGRVHASAEELEVAPAAAVKALGSAGNN